jgi:hypothetical protein
LSWESVDLTIQSAAEGHLASVYALKLDATPTQILLTVVSADPDDPGKGSGFGSGIVVRRSFLGGVVGLPPRGPPPPARSELDSVTLGAFDIPGYGKYFLRALRDSGDLGLAGLLLIAAEAVQGEGGYEYDGGPPGPAAAAADNSGTSSPGDGRVVVMGQAVNVWAVAAVAALEAMLLVIVLCMGILYCDWQGRRRRRERKRAKRGAAGGRGGQRSHDPEGAEGGGVLGSRGGGRGWRRRAAGWTSRLWSWWQATRWRVSTSPPPVANRRVLYQQFADGGEEEEDDASIPAPWTDADEMELVALRNPPIKMADTSYGRFLATQKRDAERAYQRMDAEEREAFLQRLMEIDADDTKGGQSPPSNPTPV